MQRFGSPWPAVWFLQMDRSRFACTSVGTANIAAGPAWTQLRHVAAIDPRPLGPGRRAGPIRVAAIDPRPLGPGRRAGPFQVAAIESRPLIGTGPFESRPWEESDRPSGPTPSDGCPTDLAAVGSDKAVPPAKQG